MPEYKDNHHLLLADFLQIQGINPASVLFVRISDRDLDDGRPACDPYETDTQKVLERVRKWWLLSSQLVTWQANPNCSPGLLIGLWGKPQDRLVFASVKIDRSRWKEAEHNEEFPDLISLPIAEPPSGELPHVNAFDLRHRFLAHPNVTFGRTRSQHFRIYAPGSDASSEH